MGDDIESSVVESCKESPVVENCGDHDISIPHNSKGLTMSPKKARGRPLRLEPYVITEVPKDFREAHISVDAYKELKLCRKRELNNKASKKSRDCRRNREKETKLQLEILKNINIKLKLKVAEMEKIVAFYKEMEKKIVFAKKSVPDCHSPKF